MPPGDTATLSAQLAAAHQQLERSEHARKQAEEREKLFRDELQHRVRNMLAIIRSIFSRSYESGHSLEDLGDHFHGRLDALARFQGAQGMYPQGVSYLEDMVRNELQSFEFDERIEIDGGEVEIPNDVAQLLGLAIHELVTNSIKFGALSSADAPTRLSIHWTSSDGSLVLHWQESGVAVLASVPVRQGFGREFIERALPYQLAATTNFELRPGGLSCTIAIPLKQNFRDGAIPRSWF